MSILWICLFRPQVPGVRQYCLTPSLAGVRQYASEWLRAGWRTPVLPYGGDASTSELNTAEYHATITAEMLPCQSQAHFLFIKGVRHPHNSKRAAAGSVPFAFGLDAVGAYGVQSTKVKSQYGTNKESIILTNTHSFIISTLTLIILFFFIKPSIILNSTQLLSLTLFNL